MKIKFKLNQPAITYEAGNYFSSNGDELYQLIHDKSNGFALLSVQKGTVESDFYETINGLLNYTTLSTMRPLKQTGVAEFDFR